MPVLHSCSGDASVGDETVRNAWSVDSGWRFVKSRFVL